MAIPNSAIPQFSSTAANGYMTSGDIDNNGYYWIANYNGQNWVQIDLIPGSSTYGQVIGSGAAGGLSLVNYVVSDWAYLPAYPNKLYTLAGQTISSATGIYNTLLLSFDLTTKSWALNVTYTGASGSTSSAAGKAQWGAVYTTSDGYLYATENNTGGIFRVKLTSPTSTDFTSSTPPFSQGLSGGSNDGARCQNGPSAISAKRGADLNMGFDKSHKESSDMQGISRRK